MRPLLFALPLLAATAMTAQQTFPVPNVKGSSFTDPVKTTAANTARAVTCPVSIFAREQGAPQTYWTIAQEDREQGAIHLRNGRQPAGYGVHVDLSQQISDAQTLASIRSITVQVFYVTPGTRALLLDGSNLPMHRPDNQMTRSKTFRLNANSEALIHMEANLLVGEAAGITRVHLQSIDYADGHQWTAPNASTCSTTPSLYVPVSN